MLSFFTVRKCYNFCVIIFPCTCWVLSFMLSFDVIIYCYHFPPFSFSWKRDTYIIIWDEMLSSWMKCYHMELMLSSGMQCYYLELMLLSETKYNHLGWNVIICVIIWDAMLSSGAIMISSGTKSYHLGWDVIIWSYFYHMGRNVTIWDETLSSGMKCYHLELMLSSETKCYHLGRKCYHLGWNVIIWS